MNVLKYHFKVISFSFFCVLSLLKVQAQEIKDTTYKSILDDSTKMQYSTASVLFHTDQEVYYNRNLERRPNLSLTGVHSYQSLFHNNVYSQDLGNYLTPRGRVVPSSPVTIGARYGFSVYDDFAITPDSARYFDTRSPYTQLDYVQGSKGQQRIYATHSRNITNRWNVAVMVRRMASKKLLGRRLKTDRQAENWTFGLTTRYYSKNARYQVLGMVSSMSHRYFDNGGILPDSSDQSNADLYQYQLEPVRLYNVLSKDQRVYARVYQQLSIRKDSLIQVFNQLDFNSRYNTYDDTSSATATLFFPVTGDSSASYMKAELFQGEFKAGVKGSTHRFFYALYYKGRYYHYKLQESNFLDKEGLNNIFGGELNLRLVKSLCVGVKTEQAPQSSEQNSEVSLVHKLFDVGYQQTQYTPTFQEQQLYTFQYSYNNAFNNIRLGQLSADVHLKTGALSVSPSAKWLQWNNYVYFDENAKPIQHAPELSVFTGTLAVDMTKKRWIAQNAIQFNNSSNEAIVRIPTWFNQTRLLVQGNLFKKATFMQFGVDVFFRTEWLGNNYMPVSQTFHLGASNVGYNQLNSYVLADVFLNMQIKTARFFVKMAYVNQGLQGNGYMVTPYYSGMSRTFEFGINWQFFD